MHAIQKDPRPQRRIGAALPLSPRPRFLEKYQGLLALLSPWRRIVDTQGKPVAKAGVSVSAIHAFDGHSVNPFLAAWTNRMISFQPPRGDRTLVQQSSVIARTTDADGRFVLAGAGSERFVLLHVTGAGITEADFHVVNRRGFNPTPYHETARNRSTREATKISSCLLSVP